MEKVITILDLEAEKRKVREEKKGGKTSLVYDYFGNAF
jgi:hypothetical protein